MKAFLNDILARHAPSNLVAAGNAPLTWHLKACRAITLAAAILAAMPSRADEISATNFPVDETRILGGQPIALDSLPYAGGTNSAWGQSFIANKSGLLTKVDTLLASGLDLSMQVPPLVVSFSESLAGLPSTELAGVSYTASDFNSFWSSDFHLVTVDFTNFGIPIVAGSEYIVTYHSPFGVPPATYEAPYYVGMVLFNPIPFGRVTTEANNGTDWKRSPLPKPPYTFELATRVWVVPEPASLTLAVLGVVAVAGRRASGRPV